MHFRFNRFCYCSCCWLWTLLSICAWITHQECTFCSIEQRSSKIIDHILTHIFTYRSNINLNIVLQAPPAAQGANYCLWMSANKIQGLTKPSFFRQRIIINRVTIINQTERCLQSTSNIGQYLFQKKGQRFLGYLKLFQLSL